MANGYDPGDYLGRFLEQLPSIYANQQNQRLAEERLNLQRQSAQQQQEYRSQLEERAKNTEEYNLFNQLYTKFDGNTEAQNMLIAQHPLMKKNPQLQESFTEGNQIKDEMQAMVYGFASKPPEEGILEARKALTSPYMTKDLYDTTQNYIKDATSELQFTMDEFKNTEAGVEYAIELDKFENPDKYLVTGQDRGAFLTTVARNLKEIKQEGEREYRAGFASYPTYDNVEDISDKEIDSLLTDFSTPFDERYPFTGSGTDTSGLRVDTAGKSGAGGRADTAIKKQELPKAKPKFIEDDSGLEKLIEEYAPTGSLGFLQKAATEGSVVKPVEEPLFKAITGGLGRLNKTVGELDMAYDYGEVDSSNLDFTYTDKADELKKTVKDMYDIYLKLDPEKGAYKTKFRTGNQMMRKKIKNDLSRLKKARMKALRFDKEIPQVLDSIKF
tara:strand:+ start:5113 stop:6438 length:1326 start_codon:yes stop_codon:yes gene_type:complete